MNRTLTTIILAADKGTRMKSKTAKVLHPVFHAPMIHHVLHAVSPLNPAQNIVVVGHQQEKVKAALDTFSVSFAEQKEQNGTGHAVLAAKREMHSSDGDVMILCGDTPLIKTEQLKEMYDQFCDSGATLSIMTTVLDDPTNYGRVITGENNNPVEIVEEKDADPETRKVKEINAGIYCVKRSFLFQTLKNVGTDNAQGEVYLTDIMAMAVKMGEPVTKYTHKAPLQVLGVNSRLELATAHAELQMRRNKQLMASGVTMLHPGTTDISPETSIGQDCTLSAGVCIKNNSKIEDNCTILNNAYLDNVKLGAGCIIGPGSYLKNCSLEAGTELEGLSKIMDE